MSSGRSVSVPTVPPPRSTASAGSGKAWGDFRHSGAQGPLHFLGCCARGCAANFHAGFQSCLGREGGHTGLFGWVGEAGAGLSRDSLGSQLSPQVRKSSCSGADLGLVQVSIWPLGSGASVLWGFLVEGQKGRPSLLFPISQGVCIQTEDIPRSSKRGTHTPWGWGAAARPEKWATQQLPPGSLFSHPHLHLHLTPRP